MIAIREPRTGLEWSFSARVIRSTQNYGIRWLTSPASSMNSVGLAVLARLPGQVERVDRQAVAAHAGAGVEAHEAVGLGGRGVDDLPDVDAHPVAEHRQLVDERDVHRAEDVLEQLGQLGRLGPGDRHDLVADLAVERDRAVEARRRQAADDLRRVAQRVVGAAGVDPLGREGDVEVACRRPGPTPRAAAPAARAWCRGRSSTRAPPAGPRAAPRPARCRPTTSGPRSGSRLRGQRRGHGDQHRVAVGQVARSRCSAAEALADRRAAARRGCPRCSSRRAERGHAARVGVDADHVVALLGERDGQRQADVAEPDDADLHGVPCPVFIGPGV